MSAFAVGQALRQVVPHGPRTALLALILAVLGGLDLLNRTPHPSRQVPQRYARDLPAGWRGLIWAFDLSLLFTTQKATSLVWAALAGVILIAPELAFAFLIIMIVVAVGQLIIGTYYGDVLDRRRIPGELLLVRWSRRVAGVGLLCLATVLAFS